MKKVAEDLWGSIFLGLTLWVFRDEDRDKSIGRLDESRKRVNSDPELDTDNLLMDWNHVLTDIRSAGEKVALENEFQ